MQLPGYRIIRRINQGGMSTVYLAIQLSVGREVALKVMSPALNADPVFSERFQREANIVGQLSHPNIVSIYDIGRYKNLNYIAMDYLPGGSVHDKMATGLSTQEAIRVCSQVASALDHAHEKGYIHRDIKPENILFREDDSAVLSDFGVAKTVTSASKMTNAGTVVGTPHYMSPEQARGKASDGRSDLYSLGVVFYEMLTGSVPYKADEAVAIAIKHLTAPIPTLPPQYSLFQGILNRLLAKDPDDRFQRGQELVNALANVDATISGTRPSYTTSTDSTGVQAMSLFKALVLTLYAALAVKMKEFWRFLISIRWAKGKGFHLKPSSNLTEIRTEASTGEDDRATVVSTHIHKAAYYAQPAPSRFKRFIKVSSWVMAGMLVWVTASMGITRFSAAENSSIPPTLKMAAHWTDGFVKMQASQLFDSLLNSDQSEIDDNTTAKVEPKAIEVVQQTQTPDLQEPIVEEPQGPPTFSINVAPTPTNARIRILNIKDRFEQGIELEAGRYQLAIDAKGYDSIREWITIEDKDLSLTYRLKKSPVPGSTFASKLAGGAKGPEMVVIRAGKFVMGDKASSTTSPTRVVTFRHPFAVSRYEVTFADYQHFARATKRPLPSDERWGGGSRPVINVSWKDAYAYTRWLSSVTKRPYRLLTEAEWEYMARAGTKGTIWWGTQSAEGKMNCRRGCKSKFGGLFSIKTAPVGNYPANSFGVFDTAGNVNEWTADCFKNHYLNAPKDGTSVRQNNCTIRSIRGGSIKDSAQDITSAVRQGLSDNAKRSDLGFRVMVELY